MQEGIRKSNLYYILLLKQRMRTVINLSVKTDKKY